MTSAQATVLRILSSGTGKYTYHAKDDLIWKTGEPRAGLFAQGVDFEPLSGVKVVGDWRIDTRALKSLIRMGYCNREGITDAGRSVSQSAPSGNQKGE